MIGQCGLSWQDADLGEPVLEVGYLFKRKHWRRGYAAEAARACRDYAFNVLHAPQVYSIIRDTNTASQNVAKRNGMTLTSHFTKHYRGVDMPHLVYSVENPHPTDKAAASEKTSLFVKHVSNARPKTEGFFVLRRPFSFYTFCPSDRPAPSQWYSSPFPAHKRRCR